MQTAIELPRTGEPLLITQLDQYRLIRELGSGGMGLVYEAEDTALKRRVALKVLRPNLPSEQAARERFIREARSMGGLSHDHIVPIYSVGEANSLPYMAMQLLVGETLDKRLEREPRLPVVEAVRIGREVALGLSAAHEKSLIHRDVKPSNIWLEAGTGRVKLLDFGLAMAPDNTELTKSGFVIGTPSYMSPEQARGEVLDGRSDLFSLGVILYQITAGERPFDGPTAMVIMRNLELHFPIRVNAKYSDVPPLFSNLIMELLSKNRNDRPATAKEVAHRLGRPDIVRPSHLPIAPPRSSVAPVALSTMPTPVPDSTPTFKNTSVSVDTPAEGAKMEGPSTPRSYGVPPASSPSFSELALSNPTTPQPPIMRLLFLIGVAIVGFGLFWYFNIANVGKLVIESDAPGAEVQIRRQGEAVGTSIIEREFELSTGEYELRLLKPEQGYKLSQTTVTITRDGFEKVRVVSLGAAP